MKRIIPLLLVLFLSGCGGANSQMDRALALRKSLEKGNGCEFSCAVTADFGDNLYCFELDCSVDSAGNLTFTVKEPESIAGISGTVSKDGGNIKFDHIVLAFDPLAENIPSPVCGPWMLIHTLQSGYLTSCSTDNGVLRLSLDDSYQEDAAHLDVWLGEKDHPSRGEIFWEGRRILTLDVGDFAFL